MSLAFFHNLLGQPQAIHLLTQAIVRDRLAPAYLFTGAEGIGRSLAAECLAQIIVSAPHKDLALSNSLQALPQRVHHRNHPDLLWIEPTYLHQGKRLTVHEAEASGIKRRVPPQIRLEQIREITQFLMRPPLESQRSLIVINHGETMAEPAANALLKTLEEPGYATLILIAPSVEALLPTLVSRCQRIPFYRLPLEVMVEVLRRQGFNEIIQQPEVLSLAQGSPGAAIVHWRQLQSIPSELLDSLKQPPTSLKSALNLAQQIDQALTSEAQLWLVDYLQQWYWQQTPRPQASLIKQLERIRKLLLQYVQPRLIWEVILMEIALTNDSRIGSD
ncbi:MAG: DNA polymerase III subunit delta' [Cyanobacteria bacterium LVE1205-1]|jgi:DNA polymerase-3 subunit delta'